jgi:hypothetical protein
MIKRRVFFPLALVVLISQSGILFSQKATFYVSPAGNDNSAGTIAKPLKTFAGAVTRVKEYKASHPAAEAEVQFLDGEYFIEKQVLLNQQTDNTLFTAAPDAKPRFLGSRKLTGWEKVTDKKVLEPVDPEVRNKLLVLDLGKAGITDAGDPIKKGKRPDLFLDGKPQVLSRWPNSGFTFSGKARGATPLSNIPAWYKAKGTVEGVFEYSNDRIAKWAAEKDVYLNGYWFWDWAEQYHRVSSVNTSEKIITVDKPYSGYGYKDSCRYVGLNIFCETDTEGEYYINRSTMKIYWYPPANFDPQKSDVRLSVSTDSCLISLTGCTNVKLNGLTFSGGRGSAISISGGQNCTIKDCRIESFGTDAVHIFGGTNHKVEGCLMQYFGYSGIKVIAGDRKSLSLANHIISNNVVEYISLFKHTYEPAVYFRGAGITISNNRLGHSASSAMRLEGNEILVEYNDVHNVVEESDDQGGIDSFYDPSYRGIVIRYNRWTDIRGGTHNGAAGVRLDDMISGVKIYGNIFERVGAVLFGGVQIHGGKDNTVENNIFYNCQAAVSFTGWGNKRYIESLDNPSVRKKIYTDVNIDSPLWQERYPELKGIRENADRNFIRNNLAVNCKNLFLRENGRNILDNNIYIPVSTGTIDFYLKKEVQSRFLPEAIPSETIGVRNNRWVD